MKKVLEKKPAVTKKSVKKVIAAVAEIEPTEKQLKTISVQVRKAVKPKSPVKKVAAKKAAVKKAAAPPAKTVKLMSVCLNIESLQRNQKSSSLLSQKQNLHR